MLMLLPLLTAAQTEDKTTYIVDIGHNRDCLGGLGTCRGTVLTTSIEKTTASVAKAEKNKLQMSLDKAGFAAKEWEELVETKTFPVDDESIRIDAKLIQILAIDPKFYIIKQGLYPVTVLKDKAIVVFELVER